MDLARRSSGARKASRRKSQIIEEEEEDMEEDEIEEVEAFSPVDLARGESVHSISVWDDPPDQLKADYGKERGSVIDD
jgi:hypothetical protein